MATARQRRRRHARRRAHGPGENPGQVAGRPPGRWSVAQDQDHARRAYAMYQEPRPHKGVVGDPGR